MRTFAPVVVRGEENQGVKFWGFGKTVYQELLSIMLVLTMVISQTKVNGRDVVVEFKTTKRRVNHFPSTNIRVKPNQTPITEDKSYGEYQRHSKRDY